MAALLLVLGLLYKTNAIPCFQLAVFRQTKCPADAVHEALPGTLVSLRAAACGPGGKSLQGRSAPIMKAVLQLTQGGRNT
jgi:hypothetical protein